MEAAPRILKGGKAPPESGAANDDGATGAAGAPTSGAR
jgi:hypothetical protein